MSEHDDNLIESNSCITNRETKIRRKAVRVAPSVRMRLVPLTGSSRQRESLWYQKKEIASLRRRDMQLLSWHELDMDNHPILILQALEEWSARGLENHSPEGAFLRKQTKLQSVLAVLLEQNRQFQECLLLDSDAQDLIAAPYKRVSTECQDAAHKQGLMDEEEARALREDGGTNTSSGGPSKWLQVSLNYAQTSTSTVTKNRAVATCAAWTSKEKDESFLFIEHRFTFKKYILLQNQPTKLYIMRPARIPNNWCLCRVQHEQAGR